MGLKAKDLTGTRYGRLIAKYRVGTKQPAMWMCLCDCGTEKLIWDADLKRGKSKSCGCFKKEIDIINATTHGMTGTKEYSSWLHIIQRCKNPNNDFYHRYGGRGISISKEWENDFSKFYADVGPCPGRGYSIDRIDNEKGYEAGNVRWATQETQGNNTSLVKFYEYHGERLTARQALNKAASDICMATVQHRLYKGWSLEAAIDTPVNKNYSRCQTRGGVA